MKSIQLVSYLIETLSRIYLRCTLGFPIVREFPVFKYPGFVAKHQVCVEELGVQGVGLRFKGYSVRLWA